MGEVVSGMLLIKDPETDKIKIILDARLPAQGGGPYIPIEPGPPPFQLSANTVYLDAAGATLTLSNPQDTMPRITLSGDKEQLLFRDASGKKQLELGIDPGKYSYLRAGGRGQHGLIVLYPSTGDIPAGSSANILLSAETALLILGGSGEVGNVIVNSKDGQPRITVAGDAEQVLFMGPSGHKVLELGVDPGNFSNLLAGGHGQHGRLMLYPATGDIPTGASANIILSAETGDIILKNADCAEEFDLAEAAVAEPGMVMVIEDDGSLRPSTRAYDRRVAGVVSGAGELRPGIVLDRQANRRGRVPVAMVGKVNCKVDARHGAITVGDLLTTSPTPGHAMKALDQSKAFGAVLGKALGPLRDGTGLIPVLVALQ